MSKSVSKVLIIGGGFSGMSAAIQLRKQNIETHLLEVDPNWGPDGTGISLGGATLRALRTLGILEQFLQQGSAQDGVEITAPNGHLIETIPTPRIAGPDVPGNSAIMRPVLARIMADKVVASGTQVRLGQTYEFIEPDTDGVTVTLTDGSSDRYDLVIVADGVYSKTREWLFPYAPKPQYSGQGVWRAVVPRPVEGNTLKMWVGPHLKLGLNPVSGDQAYLFLTENSEQRQHIPENEQAVRLKELLVNNFTAPKVHELAEQMIEDSVVYRPLDGLLMPRPWYRGRVVLIGDTVHATTPHLASGAGIGIEGGIILAEELERHETAEEAFEAYQNRHWARASMVVNNSGRLGQIEIEGGDKVEHANIMRESTIALAQPI
ncbi:FAD-dependent oxidoreductase [Amphritea atlantica]|uniref:FAD-dependent oxidoreductase n=1 Tax=Amphritea atlantica TaxID=355243 RepID=A0ABY5GTJ5_9GAMM|nr:FAD-dependent oxidoreductase [Amphritea atlantica]